MLLSFFALRRVGKLADDAIEFLNPDQGIIKTVYDGVGIGPDYVILKRFALCPIVWSGQAKQFQALGDCSRVKSTALAHFEDHAQATFLFRRGTHVINSYAVPIRATQFGVLPMLLKNWTFTHFCRLR